MKIKQTLAAFTFTMGLIGLIIPPVTASAAIITCGGVTLKPGQSCCGGVPTSIISCDQPGGKKAKVENTGLWGMLLLILNILTAGVVIAAVGGVVWGSILYATAAGSLDQVKKARTVIANTVLGILMYVLFYSFMNFLIPGGIFTP